MVNPGDARLLRAVRWAALATTGAALASYALALTWVFTGAGGWMTAARAMIQVAYACGGMACAGAVMGWLRRRGRS
jgi:NhaP-type Na+/H+ or K+/H+ antiporter